MNDAVGVFVSYPQHWLSWTEEFARALEQRGFRVWLDELETRQKDETLEALRRQRKELLKKQPKAK